MYKLSSNKEWNDDTAQSPYGSLKSDIKNVNLYICTEQLVYMNKSVLFKITETLAITYHHLK